MSKNVFVGVGSVCLFLGAFQVQAEVDEFLDQQTHKRAQLLKSLSKDEVERYQRGEFVVASNTAEDSVKLKEQKAEIKGKKKEKSVMSEKERAEMRAKREKKMLAKMSEEQREAYAAANEKEKKAMRQAFREERHAKRLAAMTPEQREAYENGSKAEKQKIMRSIKAEAKKEKLKNKY